MQTTTTFEKKNCLVTGGAGFIGSHLCEALLQEGRVICIDDLSNGLTANIEHLLVHPDFVFLKHDVSQPLDLENLPELARFKVSVQGVQEIFHLACPMSVRYFHDMRIATLMANSAAMKVTLDWAVKYKAKYIFTSSAMVYGARTSDTPANEQTIGLINHMQPRAVYDEGKRFAETFVSTYADTFGVDARIARLFRTYGPRLKMFDEQMITEFVVSALDDKPLTVFGTKDFKTTLLYVTDAVSALVKLAKAPAGLGPINLGGDEEFTFTSIAEHVMKLVGSNQEIRYEQPLEFLSEQPIPDISYAKQSLGWMPLIRLENGLQHMVDYVTANKNRLSYD